MKQLVAFTLLAVLLVGAALPALAAPSSKESSGLKDINPDAVLEELLGGKPKTVTVEEFGVAVQNFIIRLVRVIRDLVIPITIIGMLLGMLIAVAGMVTVNPMLRRSGGGMIWGSLCFLVMVKFAPLIVATLEGIITK